MKAFWVLLLLVIAPTVVFADEQEERVVTCLGGMGTTTTWGECLNQLFAPCAAETLGSEGHVACLTVVYDGWFQSLEGDVEATMEILPQAGKADLKGLLSAWHKFSGEKCAGVAAGREGTEASAAELGCHISETVLFSHELRRCQAGLSEEIYCVGKGKSE